MVSIAPAKSRSTLFYLSIIILLGFFVYSFMITDAFKTMDDNASIVHNPLIKDMSRLGEALKTSYFGDKAYWRPLVFVSYMIEFHFFKLNPYYYYFTNIFIHLASAVVLFFLIRFFYYDDRVAFWTALLFATHPVNWEAVANIPGRAILLSALFYFLAFYLFCCYHQLKRNILLLFLSFVSFILSLMSKESGMMLPVLILAYLWLYERPKSEAKIKYLFISVPYFVILGAYLIIRRILGMTSLFYPRTIEESVLGFLTFLRSVITHLRLFVLPLDLHFDRSSALFTSFLDPELIATVVLFAVLAVLIFRVYRRLPVPVIFFGLWFVIDLIPVSQLLVSIGTQAGRISTAEHFLYSACVGIFILMIEGVMWVYRKNAERRFADPRFIKFGLIGLYLFFFLTTIRQNILASSELAMLEQSLKYNPDNIRMVESYGYALANHQRYAEAEAFFRKVLELNPNHMRSRISLGKVLCDQGHCAEGMLEYDKVGDAKDLQELLDNNRKATYAIVLRQYEQMRRDQPLNERVHYSLGVVYAKTQRTQEALAALQEAVRLKPDYKEALFNLASLYDLLGQKENARAAFERALSLPGGQEGLDEYAQQRLKELR